MTSARAPAAAAPLRIGVITTSYPRRSGDPAGGFVGEHVRALRALGHAVDVIAAGATGAGDDTSASDEPGVTRVPGALFYRGGAPDRLERAPLRAALPAAAFTLRLAVAAAARARACPWDVIVAHWLAPSALIALPLAAPLVAIAHGGDVHTLRRLRLLGPALHALRRRRARLVFVSEQLRATARAAAPELARWLDEGALVQPMGVDAARFAALPRAPRTPPVILVAARLVPIKGVDVAIDALAHVRVPARLVIAGDGPERAALLARAQVRARARAARGAPGAIELVGEVDTQRRDQLLSEASVVVVPSRVTASGRTEGTPAIALEALAAGVPVVASAVGGLGELPAARLVLPDDPHALAREIDRALVDPPSPHDLRRAVANLDWRVAAERLLRRE
ncbi:MAG TPA: glycosyltransferase family 4 protein [Kofleriaceae bacterium]|nr:glycosyltransferase family 4 protein [Kofleriaceae bacterium]